MPHSFSKLVQCGQFAALVLFVSTALIGLITTALSIAGYIPWLDLQVSLGSTPLPWAGMAFQIGVTVLVGSIALFMPSAWRVLRLEQSHRRFEINMDDITTAYRAAHMADRAEMFGMQREFDAVRERYQYLKNETTLTDMDADLLTIAAQMSMHSREWAETFSDAKVSRVKESLKQRHADANELQERIEQAQLASNDLRHMIESAEYEDCMVAGQLLQLRDEVMELGRAKNERGSGDDSLPRLATVRS